MSKIMLVFGTRPEAVKLAPVIHELARRKGDVECVTCVTAQHRQMLDQVLDFFKIVPDIDLDLMRENQVLAALTARVLDGVQGAIDRVQPDWLMVQGDTTTCMAAGLAAYYNRVRLVHVEAGLRTGNKWSPFPEEMNRCLTTRLADLHCAPTEANRQALLGEGIEDSAVRVTGNTVIDALLWAREAVRAEPPGLPSGLDGIENRRMILVTGHRRESFGEGLDQICLALRDIVRAHEDTVIVYPVHMNPNVRKQVTGILSGQERVHLVDPVSYPGFVALMDRADIILTDSGGVQEEAPSLGKPVLVMRETTERIEGIEAGTAQLVGTRRDVIVRETERLLADTAHYERMARAVNPYGDGRAAERIIDALLDFENTAQGDARAS